MDENTLQIKADSLPFNPIVNISFQIQSAGVQSQNDKIKRERKGVTVQKSLEVTVSQSCVDWGYWGVQEIPLHAIYLAVEVL
jgi:hypothetical protein